MAEERSFPYAVSLPYRDHSITDTMQPKGDHNNDRCQEAPTMRPVKHFVLYTEPLYIIVMLL